MATVKDFESQQRTLLAEFDKLMENSQDGEPPTAYVNAVVGRMALTAPLGWGTLADADEQTRAMFLRWLMLWEGTKRLAEHLDLQVDLPERPDYEPTPRDWIILQVYAIDVKGKDPVLRVWLLLGINELTIQRLTALEEEASDDE
jgi:hypothetical protein